MKNLSALPLIGALVLSIALIFGIFLWMNPSSSVQAISKDEAITTVTDLYDGKVLETKAVEKDYVIVLEREPGIYEVKVNAETGVVHSLQLVEKTKSDETLQTDEKTATAITEEEVKTIVQSQSNGTIESLQIVEQDSEEPKYEVIVKEPTQKLTFSIHAHSGEIIESKSEKIEHPQTFISEQKAIDVAKKHLDGKVNYTSFKSNGNQSFYLVEVESSKEKAVIQINAVTGKIQSVTSETFNTNPEVQPNDNDDDDDDNDDDDDDDDD